MPVEWPIIWMVLNLFCGGIQPSHARPLPSMGEVKTLTQRIEERSLQTLVFLQSV